MNWENSELRSAIHDIMRFWLDKGVAGFRLDVISFISKPDQLRDADSEEAGDLPRFYASGPRVHQYLREMRREVLSHYDVVTVGEAPGVTAGEAIDYIAPDRQELDMVFLFDLMQIDRDPWIFIVEKTGVLTGSGKYCATGMNAWRSEAGTVRSSAITIFHGLSHVSAMTMPIGRSRQRCWQRLYSP